MKSVPLSLDYVPKFSQHQDMTLFLDETQQAISETIPPMNSCLTAGEESLLWWLFTGES